MKRTCEIEITYRKENDYHYPNLELPAHSTYQIGKYRLVYLDYLKQHKKATYTTHLTEGKLNAYLHEIDEQASEMIEAIVNLPCECGIDEELKTSDVLKWVAEMTNIKKTQKKSSCGRWSINEVNYSRTLERQYRFPRR